MGGSPQVIAVDGVLRARDLTPGTHTTGLTGVAAHCTISGDNPRAVSIIAGQITPVAFAISCAPSTVTPFAIVSLSGNGQNAGVGQKLASPLTVSVLDAANTPIEGVTGNWAVASGGGSVSPASGPTNAQGTASAEWTVGTSPGPQTLESEPRPAQLRHALVRPEPAFHDPDLPGGDGRNYRDRPRQPQPGASG